jgi:hypothetical protein
MLVFVIPLQNPETARDWAHCNALCQQTVRSALAQTHRDIRVIVVSKEFSPDISDERLTVLRMQFAPLANATDAPHRDKYRKIAIGLVEARKYAPCYIMKLDADDLVSSKLATIVHAKGHKPGYFIERGYRWSEGSRLVHPIGDFHLACGSSNIIWCEPNELPSSEDDDPSAYPILRFGHSITVHEFEKLGTPLMPIAIPSAIYINGHGNNMSVRFPGGGISHNKPNWKFYLGQALEMRKLRPLTRSMRREFFG